MPSKVNFSFLSIRNSTRKINFHTNSLPSPLLMVEIKARVLHMLGKYSSTEKYLLTISFNCFLLTLQVKSVFFNTILYFTKKKKYSFNCKQTKHAKKQNSGKDNIIGWRDDSVIANVCCSSKDQSLAAHNCL